jgi:hypothetical protein
VKLFSTAGFSISQKKAPTPLQVEAEIGALGPSDSPEQMGRVVSDAKWSDHVPIFDEVTSSTKFLPGPALYIAKTHNARGAQAAFLWLCALMGPEFPSAESEGSNSTPDALSLRLSSCRSASFSQVTAISSKAPQSRLFTPSIASLRHSSARFL